VAADTNYPKLHLWHSGREDGRGQELEAFILGQGLAVVNRVSPHFTFEGAQGSSNIDLTLAGHSLAQRITGWRVLGGESVADHNYVRFDLDLGNRFPSASREISKYSLRRMDVILLRERAKEELAAAVAAGRLGVPLLDPTTVDTAVAALAEALWGAFQAATPLKRRKSWKKAVPWWTPELSALKTRFRQARKKRRRSAQHEEEFQCERLALNQAMCTAKRPSWRKFCSEEKQPFGRVYNKVLPH